MNSNRRPLRPLLLLKRSRSSTTAWSVMIVTLLLVLLIMACHGESPTSKFSKRTSSTVDNGINLRGAATSSSSSINSEKKKNTSIRNYSQNTITNNNNNNNKWSEFDPKYTPKHIHLSLTGSDDEMSLIFFTSAKSKNYQVIYSTFKSEIQNFKVWSKKNKSIKTLSTHHNYFSYQVNGMYSELTVHEFILKDLSSGFNDDLEPQKKQQQQPLKKTSRIYYRILFNHDPSSAHSTNIESFDILNRKQAQELSIQSAIDATMTKSSESTITTSATTSSTSTTTTTASSASATTTSSTTTPTTPSSTTIPPSIEPSFQFLVYGDMDIYGDGQKTIQSILQHHMDSTQFIIHVGDIPYVWNSEHEYKWDTWFDMIEPITKKIPYVVCNGNHENASNFTSYKSRFTNSTRSLFNHHGQSPSNSNNLYYSFDYGPIHFIAISSEHDFKLQTQWMEKDLSQVDRNKTPFIIFYTHRPMYSSNENHGSYEPLRTSVEHLLRTHKIDLALYGHVHAYERTCLMRENFQCVNDMKQDTSQQLHHKYYFDKNQMSEGTIHIHVGTAGFELNPKWDSPQPQWSEYRETNHGYLRIKVYGDSLMQVEFLRDGVESVDAFLIDKTNNPQ
ncbi:hypothetical protein C9374_006372 [Naegleria lovaniensis]|uniref:Purple acid phosphatase n=1 Tax=Naegleria lovaniensis TaxID=51637 RepID=A0AA88GMQ0_NAELO|nr:uncharacterized protein C9374_006372 [Naegleria lovaniensis]KAG2381383.1 hypothetical protein C9374_006372 [Naegleria lovaniensis]